MITTEKVPSPDTFSACLAVSHLYSCPSISSVCSLSGSSLPYGGLLPTGWKPVSGRYSRCRPGTHTTAGMDKEGKADRCGNRNYSRFLTIIMWLYVASVGLVLVFKLKKQAGTFWFTRMGHKQQEAASQNGLAPVGNTTNPIQFHLPIYVVLLWFYLTNLWISAPRHKSIFSWKIYY